MAIGRVAGPILESNLDRQGVDLQFSTFSTPLLYLDFANFRAAINTTAHDKAETFTVNGNIKIGDNITITGNTVISSSDFKVVASGMVDLGDISQLRVTGGGPDLLLVTDGSGTLRFADLNSVSKNLKLSASNIIMGEPSDHSLKDHSSYRYWTPDTSLSDAADNLNQVMLNLYKGTYVGNVAVTANVTYGPTPLAVKFTPQVLGNANAYEWDFGDGVISTEHEPVHVFNTVTDITTRTIYLKAYNTNGTLNGSGNRGTGSQGAYADTDATDFITLYTPAPVPSFTLSATTIDSGTVVTFTNTSTFSERYQLFWGDGSPPVTINSNSDAGGVGGPALTHQYTSTSGDQVFNVTMSAFSQKAGPSGLTVVSDPTKVYCYTEHTPTILASPVSGNNQHTVTPNGLTVTFTNTTSTSPGATSIFANNKYRFVWGDGTTSDINIGSGLAGDTAKTIQHTFALSDPKVQQDFTVELQVLNAYSTAPFHSSTQTITVFPSPTAAFDGSANTISDKTGDTNKIGYIYTDLLGNDRAKFTFTNSSINADTYAWNYGDGITNTVSTLDPVEHTYTSPGTYSVQLLASGPTSISPDDDRLTKTGYVTILAAPTPQTSVSNTVLSLTSVGTAPALAANVTNNSTNSAPAAGTVVSRVVNSNVVTNNLSNVYDASPAVMNLNFNGSPLSTVNFTMGDDSGDYGALVLTKDADAHTVNPALYPSNFYQLFDATITVLNNLIPVGYNDLQLTHSTAGSSNTLGFVKDTLTSVPSFDTQATTMSMSLPGSLKYVSGVPYFTSGGEVSIQGLKAYNWIGQTYKNTTTPFLVTTGTTVKGSGTIAGSQTKTYAQLEGVTPYLTDGIPNANTGVDVDNKYTLGTIKCTINGASAVSGRLALGMANVNGNSASVELPTLINVMNAGVSGIDELNVPVSPTLGSGFTDNGKRVILSTGMAGPTPAYNKTVNYYTTKPFIGAVTMEGTDEAVVSYGVLTRDVTNYALQLPPGPDLTTRTGMQYFRFAFRRATMANFTVTYSGKCSGMWISAPGTQIDSTSTLNGWLDCTQVYSGAGVPGANTGAGGNGSNGCAKTAGDVVPFAQTVTNKACKFTLGSENASNAVGNQVIITVALDAGDSITSISIS